jgi:hypothetical protein
MGFFRELVSDDNTINEKSFVGVVSFLMMVILFGTDIVTGIMGIKLAVEKWIFDGFMLLTVLCFGISEGSKVLQKKVNKNKQ